MNDRDIEALHRIVKNARNEVVKRRDNINLVKKQNDEIQYTIRQQVSELEHRAEAVAKETATNVEELEKEIGQIQKAVNEERQRLIREVSLAYLKHYLLVEPMPLSDDDKEEVDKIIGSEDRNVLYRNQFLQIYETYTDTKKPVNKIAYEVRVAFLCPYKLIENLRGVYGLEVFGEREPGSGYWRREKLCFDREFKSEKDAHAFAEKKRNSIMEKLLKHVKELEGALQNAATVDEIFDFRLITDDELARDSWRGDMFKVLQARKDEILLNAFTRYRDNTEKWSPNKIKVERQGTGFVVSGHEYSSEPESIGKLMTEYFNITAEFADKDILEIQQQQGVKEV